MDMTELIIEVFVGIVLFAALYPLIGTALDGINTTGSTILTAVVTLVPVLIVVAFLYFVLKKVGLKRGK